VTHRAKGGVGFLHRPRVAFSQHTIQVYRVVLFPCPRHLL
jgi:hypothetical protein